MQARRNRSTRSLWDPNYVDESWIDDRVRLIPRMREWSAPFAGMKTGITEYNWGAESHINAATTQADILGIFGRERLDLATRWTTPETNSPVYNAIKMYRDFGDVSVNATAPNPDSVSAFAATRTSDNALTIMLINKVTSDAPVTIDIANFNATSAERWQLTSSNVITRVGDITNFTITLPAQSVTLLIAKQET